MTERTIPALALNDRGVYEIRWSEKRGDGWRSREKSTRCRDLRGAELVMARWLLERDRAEVQVLHTVGDVLDAYIEKWSKPRGNYEATDKYVLRAPREAFGKLPPNAITQDDIDAFVRERQRGKYGKSPVSSPTTLREVVALQAALNWGSRNLMIFGRPTFTFSKPAGGQNRVLWLTEAQEQDILGRLHLTTRSVALFTRMGLTYGARRGAMMALRFGPQTDWAALAIDFNEPGHRATRKRRTTAPMTPEIEADLRALHEQKGDGAYVLDRTADKDFSAFMDSIGYPWVTCHCLKHTALSLMLRGGARPEDVAAVTATDVKTILSVYRHHCTSEKLSILSSRRA